MLVKYQGKERIQPLLCMAWIDGLITTPASGAGGRPVQTDRVISVLVYCI